MSARLRRTAIALIGCGAVALTSLVGISGAANAAQAAVYRTGDEITTLPAKAVLIGNTTPAQFVTVKLAVPTGLTCATDLRSRVAGQRNAVTVAVVPDCTVPGFAKWTVTANAIAHKRNAVVKFIAINPVDLSRTVGTLVMKVNPGAGPSRPGGNGNGNS